MYPQGIGQLSSPQQMPQQMMPQPGQMPGGPQPQMMPQQGQMPGQMPGPSPLPMSQPQLPEQLDGIGLNLAKTQERLKDLADGQLMNYLQTGEGAPPMLVLSELNRRKRMRDGSAERPQATVADELMAEAMQGGIAAMPRQGMQGGGSPERVYPVASNRSWLDDAARFLGSRHQPYYDDPRTGESYFLGHGLTQGVAPAGKKVTLPKMSKKVAAQVDKANKAIAAARKKAASKAKREARQEAQFRAAELAREGSSGRKYAALGTGAVLGAGALADYMDDSDPLSGHDPALFDDNPYRIDGPREGLLDLFRRTPWGQRMQQHLDEARLGMAGIDTDAVYAEIGRRQQGEMDRNAAAYDRAFEDKHGQFIMAGTGEDRSHQRDPRYVVAAAEAAAAEDAAAEAAAAAAEAAAAPPRPSSPATPPAPSDAEVEGIETLLDSDKPVVDTDNPTDERTSFGRELRRAERSNINIPLVMMGLSMLASSRPDFFGALGEGGIMGLRTLIDQRQQEDIREDRAAERADRAAERQLDRDRLEQQHADNMRIRRDQLAQQRLLAMLRLEGQGGRLTQGQINMFRQAFEDDLAARGLSLDAVLAYRANRDSYVASSRLKGKRLRAHIAALDEVMPDLERLRSMQAQFIGTPAPAPSADDDDYDTADSRDE